jgi:universal stress protein A
LGDQIKFTADKRQFPLQLQLLIHPRIEIILLTIKPDIKDRRCLVLLKLSNRSIFMSEPQSPKNVTPAPVSSQPATSDALASPPSIPVMHLKKILTPIDFSDASRKALKYALAFAQKFQASLNLLHVVEFATVGSEFGAVELSRMIEDMQENAERQLALWVKQEIGGLVPCEALIRTGRPYAEIIEAAQTMEIDLIIIASHGHSSLAHVVLGSTVERVVRQGTCPVLVVRPQEHEFV